MRPLQPSQQIAFEMIRCACAGQRQRAALTVGDPSAVDWAYFLYFLDINGLFGLMHQAIKAMPAERQSLVPFRVQVTVRNQAERFRERWAGFERILRQINERTHDQLTVVLLKGASFKSTIYAHNPDARGMGDIDLLVSLQHSDQVIAWAREWGYNTRESKNGITAIRNADGTRSVIDFHIDDPAKTKRNPSRALRALLSNLSDSAVYAGLKMPNYEYSLAHCCKHFCEHKDDFRKILFQDDIKLIRLLDILLLREVADMEKTLALATDLNWQHELQLALTYAALLEQESTPAGFEPESIETALGPVRWPVAFPELLKRVDRAEWLSAQLGAQGSRDLWYSTEKGILNPSQQAGAVS